MKSYVSYDRWIISNYKYISYHSFIHVINTTYNNTIMWQRRPVADAFSSGSHKSIGGFCLFVFDHMPGINVGLGSPRSTV